MQSSPVTILSTFVGHTGTMKYLEGLNQEYVSELTPFIIYMVLLTILGLFGNSVVFWVYYRRFKVNPTRTYILALNICDLLINVVSLIMELTDIYFRYTFYSNGACKLVRVSMNILVQFSCYMLAAVALERRKIVCGKHAGMQRQDDKRVKITVSICCGLAAVFATPRAIVEGSNPIPSNGGASCTFLSQYLDSPFPTIYHCTLFTVVVVTFAVMSVCYGQIALHLWRHKRRTMLDGRNADPGTRKTENNETVDAEDASSRERISDNDLPSSSLSNHNLELQVVRLGGNAQTQGESDPEEPQRKPETMAAAMTSSTTTATVRSPGKRIPARTTFMLFVLTFVFVLNHLPYMIHQATILLGASNTLLETDKNLHKIINRSFYLYSAVNVLVYIFCSAKFRNECRRLFCKI